LAALPSRSMETGGIGLAAVLRDARYAGSSGRGDERCLI
jgi:hypothetical protein